MIQKVKDLKNRHLNQLQKELNRVQSELIKLGALKLILFGSGARGELGLTSDIDLIVIIESNKSFIERSQDIYQKIQPRNVDLLIYTPNEFTLMVNENLFIQHVLKEGKILFEQN